MKIAVRSIGNSLMKFLRKPTSFITHPPFSPGSIDMRSEYTQAKIRAHTNCKNISRLVILIPAEARRKSRRFEEPTSPKVSCMGQMECKKRPYMSKRRSNSPPQQVMKKAPPFEIGNIFRRKVILIRRPSEMEMDTVNLPVPAAAAAPSLGQLKRFTCRHENTLAGFDWKAAATVNPIGGGDCNMNEGSRDDDDKVMVPRPTPNLLGGRAAVERKEVNLWKRRFMEPPTTLQLN